MVHLNESSTSALEVSLRNFGNSGRRAARSSPKAACEQWVLWIAAALAAVERMSLPLSLLLQALSLVKLNFV